MKIVNIFINCIVIVDVKDSTIFYVNGEKVSLNITKEKIDKLYDGFLQLILIYSKIVFLIIKK